VPLPVVCGGCGVAFSVRNPALAVPPSSPEVRPTPAAAVRFCVNCGARLEPQQSFCAACGAAGGQAQSQLGRKLAATSADALAAVRRLATDPVAGLSVAYDALGEGRAQAAGAALCVFYALASAIGITVGARNWLGSMFAANSGGAGGFLKLILFFLIVPAVLIAVSLAARKVARAAAPVAADVFLAGAALAPIAVAVLLAGILGGANFEVIALLLTFAWVYFLLMLFAGITRVGGVTERTAAPLTPVMVVVTAWLCKVIFVALLS